MLLTVSEAARAISSRTGIDVPSRHISALIHTNELSRDKCKKIRNRRMVPRSYLAVVESVLFMHGRLGRIQRPHLREAGHDGV